VEANLEEGGILNKRPTVLVSGLAMVGALVIAIIGGAALAVGVVWAWFANTRTDGLAVFLIVSIAAGLFINVVAFTLLASTRYVPNRYAVALQSLLWIALAAYITQGTCKDNFINFSNVRWVLTSGDWQAETRAFILHWIIRGWISIAVAGLLALLTTRSILTRSTKRHLVAVAK
jgi:hypothetical protein